MDNPKALTSEFSEPLREERTADAMLLARGWNKSPSMTPSKAASTVSMKSLVNFP
eukprot:CAMPEP_0171409122 /NCGR_PEP_ID=MMETSP0880-20121228/23619_1 /TAXON_ID=67004 /ORGANISM="Thalassiosira weissflogii, Strain CCMP1336" /LENGTH=54 /DNA_ID=CAMNT_0011925535 /DNA_START=13 /DNA_END=173 /DNA_ORIENTATION=+